MVINTLSPFVLFTYTSPATLISKHYSRSTAARDSRLITSVFPSRAAVRFFTDKDSHASNIVILALPYKNIIRFSLPARVKFAKFVKINERFHFTSSKMKDFEAYTRSLRCKAFDFGGKGNSEMSYIPSCSESETRSMRFHFSATLFQMH